MRHNVAVVEQHPARVGRALAPKRLYAVPGKSAPEGIDEGVQLPDARRRGDDKVVGDRPDRPDVEQDDLLGLAVREQVDYLTGEFGALQRRPPSAALPQRGSSSIPLRQGRSQARAVQLEGGP